MQFEVSYVQVEASCWAFGDFGTLFPFSTGNIVVNRLNPAGFQ